jgi:hypothetical protein
MIGTLSVGSLLRPGNQEPIELNAPEPMAYYVRDHEENYTVRHIAQAYHGIQLWLDIEKVPGTDDVTQLLFYDPEANRSTLFYLATDYVIDLDDDPSTYLLTKYPIMVHGRTTYGARLEDYLGVITLLLEGKTVSAYGAAAE